MSITRDERAKIFRQFRHSVGAPIRQIEIEDEQLCTLLEIAIEDYAEKNKFDLKGVKMWVEFYFDKDGSLKHLAYALKPNSRNIDTRDLTAFLMSFTNTYKMQISTNRRFYTNMHASFPIASVAEMSAGKWLREA